MKVRGLAFDKGTVRFSLESVGQPRVGDRRPKCKELQPGMQLVFTGLDPEAVTIKTTARIDAALLTPEEYLRRKGGSFDRPQAAPPAEVASQLPDANDSERRLSRAVVAWPRPLLSVEALYHDASKRGLHERLVGVEAVVGTDGRVYRPVVKASIDRAHEAAWKRRSRCGGSIRRGMATVRSARASRSKCRCASTEPQTPRLVSALTPRGRAFNPGTAGGPTPAVRRYRGPTGQERRPCTR